MKTVIAGLMVALCACGRIPAEQLGQGTDAGGCLVVPEEADAGRSDAGDWQCATAPKLDIECAQAYAELVGCCGHDVGAGAEYVCRRAETLDTACAVLQVKSCAALADAGWCD